MASECRQSGPGQALAERRAPRLAQQILRLANSGVPRADFVRSVIELLMDLTGSNAVEIRLEEGGACAHFRVGRGVGGGFAFSLVECCLSADRSGEARGDRTRCGDHSCVAELSSRTVTVPLLLGDDVIGWLQVDGRERESFGQKEVATLARLAETLGIALVNQRAQAALRERVKELTGLYTLSQLAERPDVTLEELFQGIADLLPPAWQYPEITVGRIVVDGRCYASCASWEGPSSQRADIVVGGRSRGFVEVLYREARPQLDEGPFLKEERSLLDAIAREVAAIIERRQAQEERARLQAQLRHADRLATIGQLAAGVAHELNEPLGAVLGFAQLARKAPMLPAEVGGDLLKIEAAALHAREIVKKLMLFARQAPPRKARVNLNQVVSEGLLFLEARCAKRGIEVRRVLDTDLPEIVADPAQLQQVLVNLVVNAEQAMPEGGRLSIVTEACEGAVVLRVEDTGVGMSEEVMGQIFLPFYTTKDVTEGTGLGLAVVHGIVTSHGGNIRATSEVGAGSRFEVELPMQAIEDP